MLGFGNNFIDKDGNFNSVKFLELLKKSRKKLEEGNSFKGKTSSGLAIFNSVSKNDVRKFINKFSNFVTSGMDAKSSLSIIAKQIENPYLKQIVQEMKNNIDYGIQLSETMRQYPKIFDSLTVALISIGEKTGNLGNILVSMDKKMLEQIELKGKVKGALTYPIILVGLTIAMVVFMMIYIIPTITESFRKTGVELPALTQIVINISDFLTEKYYIIIMIFIGLVFLMKFLRSTFLGNLFLGGIGIKLPIFGYIVKRSNTVYFINAFTLLLNSGVLLLEALETSGKLLPNIHYQREIIRIKGEIESGITMSKALGLNMDYGQDIYQNKLFEEEFAYIVNMGEETGTLSKSLGKLGVNYNSELKRYIGNLSTMLEPIILVFVGFLVGTIVIAIMLPFFNIGKVVKAG